MAVSRNNRKKKRKRTQNHSAPVPTEGRLTERDVDVKQKEKEKRAMRLNITGIVLMVLGFIIAWRVSRFVGYPITFCGGLMGLISTRMQNNGRKVTLIGYTLYCIMVAYMWIFEFLAPGRA